MTYEPKDFQEALKVTEAHRDYWNDKTKKVVRHALAALADENWQLVPKEPTGSMMDAANQAWEERPTGQESDILIWERMLEAAPQYGDTDAKTE